MSSQADPRLVDDRRGVVGATGEWSRVQSAEVRSVVGVDDHKGDDPRGLSRRSEGRRGRDVGRSAQGTPSPSLTLHRVPVYFNRSPVQSWMDGEEVPFFFSRLGGRN